MSDPSLTIPASGYVPAYPASLSGIPLPAAPAATDLAAPAPEEETTEELATPSIAIGTIVRHDGRYGLVLAHRTDELGDGYDVALFGDVRVSLRPEAFEVD